MWRKHHKQLSGHYWKEHTLWSDGYFAASIGEVSAETIRRYIESQGGDKTDPKGSWFLPNQ
jgi:putative transposase